jgi:hypothetical protein
MEPDAVLSRNFFLLFSLRFTVLHELIQQQTCVMESHKKICQLFSNKRKRQRKNLLESLQSDGNKGEVFCVAASRKESFDGAKLNEEKTREQKFFPLRQFALAINCERFLPKYVLAIKPLSTCFFMSTFFCSYLQSQQNNQVVKSETDYGFNGNKMTE